MTDSLPAELSNTVSSNSAQSSAWFSANGKVILFAEHAVVYGVEAVAAAVPDLVRARAFSADQVSWLKIPYWHVDINDLRADEQNSTETKLLRRLFFLIASELGIEHESFGLEIDTCVPPASGLGASAAVAVAAIKALAALFGRTLSLHQINDIAYKCEQLSHGTPSGLDNTLATFGGVLRFKRQADAVSFSPVLVRESIELLIALSGKKGFTAQAVAKVREAKSHDPQRFDRLFTEIARLSAEGMKALADNDKAKLALLFNQNQYCLAEMGLSCREIERVLTIAESSGCKGGKLTGSGDGGAVILVAENCIDEVEADLNKAGFSTLRATLHAT